MVGGFASNSLASAASMIRETGLLFSESAVGVCSVVCQKAHASRRALVSRARLKHSRLSSSQSGAMASLMEETFHLNNRRKRPHSNRGLGSQNWWSWCSKTHRACASLSHPAAHMFDICFHSRNILKAKFTWVMLMSYSWFIHRRRGTRRCRGLCRGHDNLMGHGARRMTVWHGTLADLTSASTYNRHH